MPGSDVDLFEEPLWSFEADGAFYPWTLTVEGIIYVGSEDDHLRALDVQTGEVVWRLETGGDVFPSAVVDGVLYAGSEDGHIYALDASTGELLQTYGVGEGMPAFPRFAGEAIYTGSEDGRVYAMDASHGEILWSFDTDGDAVLFEVTDEVTIAGEDSGLVGLDTSTGEVRWLHDFRGNWFAWPSLVLASGVLYVSLGTYMEAVDALTGDTLWSYETGAPARLWDSTPAVVGRAVYVGLADGDLHAVDAVTGALIWRSSVPESNGTVLFGSPKVVGEVVYAYSSDLRLYAFATSTGQLLWRSAQPGPPIIFAYLLDVIDGVIFFGSYDSHIGHVHAVEAPFAN